tara:strand:- start:129 stop:845 length:717 start_codon:yes stop_codon:yes gene_type:complete
MLKFVEKMSKNYSPNFNLNKRSKSQVKYLIYHYTGMKSEKEAIKRLTKNNSNVSCHYLIKKDGEIIQIVPDLYVAWHAGISFWKKDVLLNNKSIGIELSNPGHMNGYTFFSKKQINSLIKLSKILIKKFNIKKENVLGHSDIAPLRKIDPGEKFPWKLLSKKNICLWHNLNKNICKKLRNSKVEEDKFYKLLFNFGYKSSKKKDDKIRIYKNFQRRFRPQLISSVVDKECYTILKTLI